MVAAWKCKNDLWKASCSPHFQPKLWQWRTSRGLGHFKGVDSVGLEEHPPPLTPFEQIHSPSSDVQPPLVDWLSVCSTKSPGLEFPSRVPPRPGVNLLSCVVGSDIQIFNPHVLAGLLLLLANILQGLRDQYLTFQYPCPLQLEFILEALYADLNQGFYWIAIANSSTCLLNVWKLSRTSWREQRHRDLGHSISSC